MTFKEKRKKKKGEKLRFILAVDRNKFQLASRLYVDINVDAY